MTCDDVITFYREKNLPEESIDVLQKGNINGASLKVLKEEDLVNAKLGSLSAAVILRHREELMPVNKPTSSKCENRYVSEILRS